MKNKTVLSERVMQLISTILFLEKRNIFTYKNTKLFPSEIHLMKLIAIGQCANATAMAVALGVTKGAVSQTLSRLEKKNIIVKANDVYNKNGLIISFTDFGKTILKKFDEKRTGRGSEYEKYLNNLPVQDQAVIETFITQVEKFLSDL
jgi:DNA-binding MarR family transcriptional regulator